MQKYLHFCILHRFEVILLDVLTTSNRIKLLCKSNGVTVKTLLESTDINRNFIYDLKRSGRIPSVDKFERIADYLDCSVDYLLGRSPTPERDGGSFSPALQQLLDAADGLTNEEIVKSVEYMRFLRACRK